MGHLHKALSERVRSPRRGQSGSAILKHLFTYESSLCQPPPFQTGIRQWPIWARWLAGWLIGRQFYKGHSRHVAPHAVRRFRNVWDLSGYCSTCEMWGSTDIEWAEAPYILHCLRQPHPVQNGPSQNANSAPSENNLWGLDLNTLLLLFPILVNWLEHEVSCRAPVTPLHGGWVTIIDAPPHASFPEPTSELTRLPAQKGQEANAYCLINKASTSTL